MIRRLLSWLLPEPEPTITAEDLREAVDTICTSMSGRREPLTEEEMEALLAELPEGSIVLVEHPVTREPWAVGRCDETVH